MMFTPIGLDILHNKINAFLMAVMYRDNITIGNKEVLQ